MNKAAIVLFLVMLTVFVLGIIYQKPKYICERVGHEYYAHCVTTEGTKHE